MTAASAQGGFPTRALARVRHLLAPIGDRSALSARVGLLYFPVSLVSQFIDSAAYGGSIQWWLLVGVLSLAVLLGGLAAARRLLGERDPSPLQVLAVFAALGMSRTLAVGLAALWLGLRPGLDLEYRIVSGALIAPAMLGVLALAVCRHDTHRSLVADLEAKRAILLETERTMDAELQTLSAELVDAVHATLRPAFRELEAAFDAAAGGASANAVVRSLGDLVESQVRPVSRGLLDAPAAPPWLPPEPAPQARRVRVPLPPRLRLQDGIKPGLAAMLAGISITTPAFRDFPPLPALAYAVGLALWVWAALTLARRLLGTLELQSALALLALAAVHLLFTLPFVPLVYVLGGRIPSGTLVSGVSLFPLFGVLTGTIALVDARRSATEAELTGVVERLGASVEVTRRSVRLTRRRLAEVLHGRLQGTLLASALRLSEAPAPSAELLESVRADVENALRQLDASAVASNRLSRTLDEIVGTWGGQRSIRVHIHPAATAALSGHPDAEEAVAAVVRESVSNALRHGLAKAVEVTVRLQEPAGAHRLLEIVVRDDGIGWPPHARAGLGSGLFSELCYAWDHEDDGAGTTFTAQVTLV